MKNKTAAIVIIAAILAALQGTALGLAGDVPREADARSQYAVAALLQKKIRGKKGEERQQAREEAAAAYEAVARYFPEEAPLAGRALYRAGQLYEHLKDREKGVRCLKQVLGMRAEDRTKAKAHNLLGHIYRRARNYTDAIKEYEVLIQDHPKVSSQVAEALVWLGKCKARMGDHKGARDAWQDRLKRFPDRTGLVIGSLDLIACSLFREGKVEEARKTLIQCQERFQEAARDTGPQGQRIRKALERMKIVKLLKKNSKPQGQS